MKLVPFLCLFKIDTGSEQSVASVIKQLHMASNTEDAKEEQEAFNCLNFSSPLTDSISEVCNSVFEIYSSADGFMFIRCPLLIQALVLP